MSPTPRIVAIATIATIPIAIALAGATPAGASPLASAGLLFGGSYFTRDFDAALPPSGGSLEHDWGFALGASSEWRLPWERLTLLVEAHWVEKGVARASSYGETGSTQSYLSIPVLVRREFPVGAMTPFAVLGVGAERRMTSREHDGASSAAMPVGRWAPAVQVGGGLLGRRLEVRVVYSRDLSESSGYNTLTGLLDTVHNSGFLLLVGMRVPLR
jgi:hypothetical protein